MEKYVVSQFCQARFNSFMQFCQLYPPLLDRGVTILFVLCLLLVYYLFFSSSPSPPPSREDKITPVIPLRERVIYTCHRRRRCGAPWCRNRRPPRLLPRESETAQSFARCFIDGTKWNLVKVSSTVSRLWLTKLDRVGTTRKACSIPLNPFEWVG